MNITVETDKNGQKHLVLTDTEKYGTSKKGLTVANILIQAATGNIFLAPPDLPGLSRLGEPDVELVTYFFNHVGEDLPPKIFVGDAPPDG